MATQTAKSSVLKRLASDGHSHLTQVSICSLAYRKDRMPQTNRLGNFSGSRTFRAGSEFISK
ncbi:MAG: hypothetical protein CL912_27150 [Deltaproteobacteria bacterium]|nr:hypothetical protein [Deltaproteobacteria bacterium]